MAERVLVVEDEPTTLALVSYKLKNSGFEVLTATDGSKALDVLEKETVSIILLDLMMPLMSGKELLIRLKQEERWKNIPVIILTAKTLEKEVVEGLSLGADDFMKKPFSPSELVARVRGVLARRKTA